MAQIARHPEDRDDGYRYYSPDEIAALIESDQMSVKDAVELIKETPANKRASFAKQIYAVRKRRGHTRARRDEVPF